MVAKDAASDAERLKADLKQIQDDVAALAATLKTLAAERGHEGKDALKGAAAATEREAKAAVAAVETQISERPFSSILVAFGLGLLIGKLFDR